MSTQFDFAAAKQRWHDGDPEVIASVFEAIDDLIKQRDAAVDKLTPTIKKLTVSDGELTATLSDPYHITALIARQLRDLVDAEGGPNYAEISFKEAGVFKPIVVAVARSAEQTPHALRLKAEAEAAKLRDLVDKLKQAFGAVAPNVLRLIEASS